MTSAKHRAPVGPWLAARFTRVSDSRNQNPENSHPAQLRGIDDGIVKNPNHVLYGIPIVKTYQVTHQSHRGLAGRGTQYDDMIRDAKAGVFGYLLVDKIDRLGRDLLESVAMVEAMQEAGVQIVSAKEPFDPDQPAGWLMSMLMRVLADFYSRNLALEVRKGLREKLERGEWPSRPPYGYRFRDDQPRILPGRREHHINILTKHEPFASHVSAAFTEFATGNYTLEEWEAAAFGRGMRTVAGKRITDGMWSRYFHDSIYIGRMRYDMVPGQDFAVHPDTPHLTTPETFRKVQAILAERVNSADRTWKHQYPLVSVLWSSATRARMYGTTVVKRKTRRYRYYYTMPADGRPRKYFHCSTVEAAFEAFLDTISIPPAGLAQARRDLKSAIAEDSRDRVPRKSSLTLQLERLTRIRRNLVVMMAAGDVTEEDFRREKRLNDAAIRELEGHLDDLASPLERRRSELEDALFTLSHLGDLWRGLDDDNKRRRFAKLVFKRVTINGHGRVVDFQFQPPFDRLYDLDSPSRSVLRSRDSRETSGRG